MAPTTRASNKQAASATATASTKKAPTKTKTTALTKDAGVTAAGRKRRAPVKKPQKKQPKAGRPKRQQTAPSPSSSSSLSSIATPSTPSSSDSFHSAASEPEHDFYLRRKNPPFPLPSFARHRARHYRLQQQRATPLPEVREAQQYSIAALRQQTFELHHRVNELSRFWVDAAMDYEDDPRWKRGCLELAEEGGGVGVEG